MMLEIYNKISFAIGLIIGTITIAHRMPKRKYFILRAIICIAVIFLYSYFKNNIFGWTTISRNPVFTYFFVFILCVGAIAVCFKGDFWTYLFCGTAGYCIQHFSYMLFGLLFLRLGLTKLVEEVIMYTFLFTVCLGVYFFFVRKFIPSKSQIAINKKLQVVIATVVLAVSVFISHYGKMYSFQYKADELLTIVLLYSIITSALGLFIEFSLFFMKKTETELTVMKRLWSSEREQYRQSKENIELINIKCHDLKHQIEALKGKLNEKEYNEITQSVGIYDSAIKTGNSALDVVLTEKSLHCAKEKIRLTCLVDGIFFNNYPDYELYSLFGNALDNAIENVQNLDEEKRVVSISTFKKNNKINLQIENYFDGKLEFKDGLPQTKKNMEYHGFGIKSMKMLVEKHCGTLTAVACDDIFILSIVLPIDEDKNSK